jgi:hypothetical protein
LPATVLMVPAASWAQSIRPRRPQELQAR